MFYVRIKIVTLRKKHAMFIKNDLLLRTINREQTKRYPVWLMRQAGRYLSSYRKVREQAGSFKGLLENPVLAAEVTIQPVEEIGVDAAIIFSDILVVAEAMGCPYVMQEHLGPVFPKPVQNTNQLYGLSIAKLDSNLSYTLEAIRITKARLNGEVPLIGFCGAPWTLFAYCTEGNGSKTFSMAKRLLFQEPDFAKEFLEMLTLSSITYLKGQIAAGVDLVQIFDSWAGILSPEDFKQWSLPYIQKICEAITEVPVIIFARGTNASLSDLREIPCEVISIDWNTPIKQATQQIPNKILQGNIDPCYLYASPKWIHQMLTTFLNQLPEHHIVNLGHGLYPDIPSEHVKYFVDCVKNHSKC